MVCGLHWTLDFTGSTNLIDVHEHAVNALIMLIDLTLTRWPFYLKHFYMCFIYTAIYCTFNAFYVCLGGTDAVSRLSKVTVVDVVL